MTKIDQSSMKAKTKFSSYFKEFVLPKVRTIIKKLPPNSEDYKKAKEILIQRNGDKSEVINAYILQIIPLAFISETTKANNTQIL